MGIAPAEDEKNGSGSAPQLENPIPFANPGKSGEEHRIHVHPISPEGLLQLESSVEEIIHSGSYHSQSSKRTPTTWESPGSDMVTP